MEWGRRGGGEWTGTRGELERRGVPSGDGRWERWDRCYVRRGVSEGGRVMAGQGQTKPCALARDESGIEVGERVGGSYRPARISACLCNPL